jgi:YD repeat-containing protein
MSPIKKPKIIGNPKICMTGVLVFLLCAANLGASNTITYTYDALGRLTFVSDPANGNRDYDYDKAGNRLLVSVGTASDSAAEPGSGPTYISITSSAGAILPAAASLYTVTSSCSGQPQACTWLVRKLYGDQNPVVVVVQPPPNATNPACWSGATQQITSGYSRSGCSLSALSTVYGQ